MSAGRGQIVVVEDDFGMRRALARVLGAAGFSTSVFASGEALLESHGANEAACLVLDVHLPGVSGFEVQRRLSEAGARKPVIFITAHDNPESRKKAADLGASAYLPKPFPGRDLVQAVEAAVAANIVN